MSDTTLIFSLYGFTLIAGLLLGFGGFGGPSISIPDSYASGTDSETTEQGVVENFIECSLSIINPAQQWTRTFEVCSRGEKSIAFSVFTDILTFVFSVGEFFFQMLTLQLPIPGWMNTILIAPAAVATVYVALKFARGTS